MCGCGVIYVGKANDPAYSGVDFCMRHDDVIYLTIYRYLKYTSSSNDLCGECTNITYNTIYAEL